MWRQQLINQKFGESRLFSSLDREPEASQTDRTGPGLMMVDPRDFCCAVWMHNVKIWGQSWETSIQFTPQGYICIAAM